MSSYTINLTLQNIRTIIVMFLDIFIMWLMIYYALKIVRSNSRTIQIFKGLMLVVTIDGLAKIFGLKTLQFFTDMFINWGFLAIIIIFQPELRSLLERIGKSNVFSRITTLTGNEKEHLVDQIVTAVMLLSTDSTGSLISIEQSHSLDDYVSTGIKINSDVTAELLTSIFVTSTPLHDGAVIIQGDKITAASVYFPPTNLDLPSRYGARHRAAIGISEVTDAVTIVVSEETGNISITEGGKIFVMHSRDELRNYLMRVICGSVTEAKTTRQPVEENIGKQEVAKTDENLSNTGVLRKLSLQKQEAKNTKVPVESVVPSKRIDDIHKRADQIASNAEMKLPHKKDRPVASYPKQTTRVIPTMPTTPVVKPIEPIVIQPVVQQPVETPNVEKPIVLPQDVKTGMDQPISTPVEEKTQATPKIENTQSVPRMTSEDVRAAREAFYRNYAHKNQDSSMNQNGGDSDE